MPLPLIVLGSSLAAVGIGSWLQRKKYHSHKTTSTTQTTTLKSLLDQRQKGIKKCQKQTDTALKLSMASISTTGFATWAYPPLLLASIPLITYSSLPIFQATWHYWQQKRKLHTSAIDSVAIVGTLASGYYFAAALISGIYFLGQRALLKTESHASQKLLQLFGDHPRTVWLWKNGLELEVPFDEISLGDTVVVHAGETIPFDGKVTDGNALVDYHLLGTEFQLQEKQIGDVVLASTLLTRGTLSIRVEKAGKDSIAVQIADTLQSTLSFQAAAETHRTQRVSQATLPTMTVSGLSLEALGPISASTIVTCNIADIACITIPVGVLNHLKLAAERGISIKDGQTLKHLGEVNTIILDTHSALTQTIPEVGNIHTYNGFSDTHILSLAASAEHNQTHPTAQAIINAALARGLKADGAQHTQDVLEHGIRTRIRGQDILLGNRRLLETANITIPSNAHADHTTHTKNSFIWMAIDGRLAGVLSLQPKMRPEVPTMIQQLRKHGLSIHILSSDPEQPTRQLANTLGVEHYQANIRAEGKANYVQHVQTKGGKVCFVGDDTQDMLAMKKAQLAISLNGAINTAMSHNSIICLNQQLSHLDQLFSLAQTFQHNMNSDTACSLPHNMIGAGSVLTLHMNTYDTAGFYLINLNQGLTKAPLSLINEKPPSH